jgi:hypothetical protein
MLSSYTAAMLFALWPFHARETHYSYVFSKQYIVNITQKALDNTPIWADGADHPPLSARKATQLADKMRATLVKNREGYTWTLKSISLIPAGEGKWYWLAYYQEIFFGISSGLPNDLRLVVLMDGTVIKPVVKERSDGTP